MPLIQCEMADLLVWIISPFSAAMRHTGVDPVEVARRVGHSPAVLWRFYGKSLRGSQQNSNRRILAALADQSDRRWDMCPLCEGNPTVFAGTFLDRGHPWRPSAAGVDGTLRG